MKRIAAVIALALSTAALAQPVQAPPPFGGAAVVASATGTTAATAATLAKASGKLTYLCGFSIRANASAAATATATVVGLAGGTLTFEQFTAALAGGIGVLEPPLGPACLPASGSNVDVVITSAAPGSGGVVSVNAWGFQVSAP